MFWLWSGCAWDIENAKSAFEKVNKRYLLENLPGVSPFTTKLVALEMIIVNLTSTEITVLWITSKLLMPFINPCNQGMCSVTKMDAVETGCRSRLGMCRLWM